MVPSLLSKFTVTCAPAGTVIVLILRERFWATRSIVTDWAAVEELGEGAAVGDAEAETGGGTEDDGADVVAGTDVVVGPEVVAGADVVVGAEVVAVVADVVVEDAADEQPAAISKETAMIIVAINTIGDF